MRLRRDGIRLTPLPVFAPVMTMGERGVGTPDLSTVDR